MIRHLFIAGLRNMAANKLQTAIAVLGLSIGITAALLMALVIRDQLTFDHFVPGYERTYLLLSKIGVPGQSGEIEIKTQEKIAALLKLNLPEVENTTRLMLPPENASGETLATLKRGQVTADEVIYWADPNVFDVLPLPLFKGDLANALKRPDGIVLPRASARKYFGSDDAVGQTILVNGHPMTVRAIVEDLPVNGTSLQSGIFASGLASFSPMASLVDRPGSLDNTVMTYVRLKPRGSPVDTEHRLRNVIDKLVGQLLGPQGLALATKMGLTITTVPVSLDQLPLSESLHPGAKAKLAVAGIVGTLILFIAAINFVNLLTARAGRRALEVGVRKACGAARRLLVLQFLGESILTVLFATCAGMALSEWLLPPVNAFLATNAGPDFWRNALMLCELLSGVVVLGLLAGAYPAFVLSSFRPAGVLKGISQRSRGAGIVRNALVVLQFAILIALVVVTTVVYQQNLYATRDGLRGNIDQMLVVRGGCKPSFRDELRRLPGVAGVSCGSDEFFEGNDIGPYAYKGQTILLNEVGLNPGMFALYAIKPLAGSLPPATIAGDADPTTSRGLILNEAAVRRLGFSSSQAAIGQALPRNAPHATPSVSDHTKATPTTVMAPIVAVVPDFTFKALADQPIPPTVYIPSAGSLVSIKLKGEQVPETLTAIDRLWGATNPSLPISRLFLNDHMQELYLSMLREAQIFAVFSAVAVFLACLGLFGLSISTAERRTKEIGIRKVMGATTGEVVAFLLWEFSQPVLWANVIAWPVAWWLMRRWLSGFAYHVELQWWVFAAASVSALLIALFTVAGQAVLVARQKPVLALRYE